MGNAVCHATQYCVLVVLRWLLYLLMNSFHNLAKSAKSRFSNWDLEKRVAKVSMSTDKWMGSDLVYVAGSDEMVVHACA